MVWVRVPPFTLNTVCGDPAPHALGVGQAGGQGPALGITNDGHPVPQVPAGGQSGGMAWLWDRVSGHT
jgi:hypothetical protein